MKKLKINDELIKNVEYMAENGMCSKYIEVECSQCPFYRKYNDGRVCHNNGFADICKSSYSSTLQQSAKDWLAKHVNKEPEMLIADFSDAKVGNNLPCWDVFVCFGDEYLKQ